MSDALLSFMRAVLGEDATTALMKAGERSEALAAVIGPRTVLGWCLLASRWPYDGVVPGHDDSLLHFKKSEKGLTGIIAMGSEQLDFENAQPENLASMMCVGLGCQLALVKSEGVGPVAMAKLGETIDLMVKARVVSLLKAEVPQCKECHRFFSADDKHSPGKCPHCSKMEKAELPGQSAKPLTQDAPQSQQAPTATAPRRSATKAPAVSMTKSMMESRCTLCGSSQFSRSGDFRGCYCLRDLAKHAHSEPYKDGCRVVFGPEWGPKSVQLLLDIVGATDGK